MPKHGTKFISAKDMASLKSTRLVIVPFGYIQSKVYFANEI